MCAYTRVCVRVCVCMGGWVRGLRAGVEGFMYRAAKTHRILYLYRSFSAKVTYI